MSSREDMAELHGDDFVENFEQEFEIAPEDIPVPFSYRLKQFLNNQTVWYVAGVLDALLIVFLLTR